MQSVATFNKTSLEVLEREVVIQTIATYVECHYCVAMHTSVLTSMEAPTALIEALREKKPLEDPRLEAVRQFTLCVLTQHGQVGDEALNAFFAQGFSRKNALEVVLGVGVYTISTFANRMIEVALDPAFQPFAWEASTS